MNNFIKILSSFLLISNFLISQELIIENERDKPETILSWDYLLL